ncbi:sodium:proton antiporter [Halalkalibacterium halodurans]|uniref:Na+/H+ antiporter n=1 Tax=Halalkalibacterium halodurans (strain ATCC BAA-125 / DSM 18197 / FERM 7344 / JCM 9153 / C-125) TaxID=272558 RepID=Q9KCZ9_HALH5|nr:hypothetical protein [Halalkalibacterium halodurans]MDY7221944.1 sodium:proton antiporter [Halalkalibacterium halodurans]MDY7241220.1 sodium:proton antiporter [Halalkalibacterium halodurans]MED4080731.1 sodium:proton antiporter [Halalkalibacterium halodurans]MED4087183.1 sodium:proton antiporter [Halalkalibacterium halodurans]MED4107137.1 sodium:proton antiporter [Halalkalibacterium halodurans]
MFGRIVSVVALIGSLYFAVRYRYRVLNAMLGQRWLRRIAVSFAMQIPFVRNNLMGNLFNQRSPQG